MNIQQLKELAESVDFWGTTTGFSPEKLCGILDFAVASAERLEAAERERDELKQRLANAEHQLHMSELAKFNLRNQRKAQFRKRREVEAELARRDAAAGEPVAWVCGDEEIRDFKAGREVTIVRDCDDSDMEYLPLYTAAQPAVLPQPDPALAEFYEVASYPDLVCELVKHIEQLQDSAKRNVKPWEDTFPPTLLPAYIDKVKRADDAALGAQPQKTVELPEERKSDDVSYGGSGAFSVGKNSGFNECLHIVRSSLDAAGVKWEVKK